LDLKGEPSRFNNSSMRATIAADVRRFCHRIKSDEVFGTHRGDFVFAVMTRMARDARA
jgi:hypothetical protein